MKKSIALNACVAMAICVFVCSMLAPTSQSSAEQGGVVGGMEDPCCNSTNSTGGDCTSDPDCTSGTWSHCVEGESGNNWGCEDDPDGHTCAGGSSCTDNAEGFKCGNE